MTTIAPLLQRHAGSTLPLLHSFREAEETAAFLYHLRVSGGCFISIAAPSKRRATKKHAMRHETRYCSR